MRHFPPFLWMIILCLLFPYDSIASKTNIEETLIKAKQEDKHIFLRFSASWCLPCQLLDDQLSQHPEIIKELNEIYLGIELDYDDLEDQEWFVKYGVQCLPTMIVINNNGEEIDRIDGTVSMIELTSFMHINAKHPIDKLVSKELSALSTETKKTNILYYTPETPNQIFFSPGFTIQFGAFSSYSNAQNLAESLKSNEDISTIIIEESTNGISLFKVRQTSFAENISGRAYVKAYKEKGIECLLKKAS